MDRTTQQMRETPEHSLISSPTLVMVSLFGLALLGASSGGCGKGSKSQPRRNRAKNVVPNPLEHPAEFCFATCARRTYCRLGRPADENQASLFAKEKARCIQGCIRWMKAHPFDALAYHECYKKSSCAHMTSCLAETRRLLQAAADPDRQRQCLSLCVDFGQCDASERKCMERCKAPDLAIFRALEHCENRSCPAVRDCLLQYVPSLEPAQPVASAKAASLGASGRISHGTETTTAKGETR